MYKIKPSKSIFSKKRKKTQKECLIDKTVISKTVKYMQVEEQGTSGEFVEGQEKGENFTGMSLLGEQH